MQAPFHLAFPVNDLESTRDFYVNVLGCGTGRESASWIDFDLYGHQIVAHVAPEETGNSTFSGVDEQAVPVKHFGVCCRGRNGTRWPIACACGCGLSHRPVHSLRRRGRGTGHNVFSGSQREFLGIQIVQGSVATVRKGSQILMTRNVGRSRSPSGNNQRKIAPPSEWPAVSSQCGRPGSRWAMAMRKVPSAASGTCV